MNKQKNKVILLISLVCCLIVSLTLVSNKPQVLGTKSNNTNKQKVSNDKNSQVVDTATEIKLKGYEKAVNKETKSPSTNSTLFEKNMSAVVEDLNDLATSEDDQGNIDLGEEIQEIADTEEEEVEDVVDIIEEVEAQNKFKVLLIGTDYNNLGKLRSNLVHNRNQIRKLTKTTAKVQSAENSITIQEQLLVLVQERERIKDVIEESESQFSILGWIRKYLSGYISEPLDTEVEEELIEEVVDVLDEEIIEELIEPDLELDQSENN